MRSDSQTHKTGMPIFTELDAVIAIITRTHCQGVGMGRAFVIVRPTAVTIRDALLQLQASKPQMRIRDLCGRTRGGLPASTWYSAPESTPRRRRRRSRRSQLAHRSGKPASCPTAPPPPPAFPGPLLILGLTKHGRSSAILKQPLRDFTCSVEPVMRAIMSGISAAATILLDP